MRLTTVHNDVKGIVLSNYDPPLSIFFSYFGRKYPQIYVEKLEMPNLTFFAAEGHTKPLNFTVGHQWKKSENLRRERIALTRAIFEL